MLLADGFRGHFGIALSKQILGDQPLHMASVARHPLYVDSMCGATHPVLTIPTPIAKDLLVDLVFRSRLSSINACSCSARRGQSSQVPRTPIRLYDGLVDSASRQSEQVVLRRNVASVAWQILLSEAREFFGRRVDAA
jgi:hypothetical protein